MVGREHPYIHLIEDLNPPLMCTIIPVIKRGARNTITLQAPCGYFRGKQAIMATSPQLTFRHLLTRPLETRIIIKRGA